MSSSGLVPMPLSKRVLKEYWALERTPLSVEIVPVPSFKPPCQTADALRFILSSVHYSALEPYTTAASTGPQVALGRWLEPVAKVLILHLRRKLCRCLGRRMPDPTKVATMAGYNVFS